jgi:hypothetical protein
MAGTGTGGAVRRCPSCGARNRGAGPWCTLCHAPRAGIVAEAQRPAEPVPDDPADGRAATDGGSGPDPLLVQELMLRLAAQESGIELPRRLAPLKALLRPGAPKGLALGVGLAAMVGVTALVVVLLALVGLAL